MPGPRRDPERSSILASRKVSWASSEATRRTMQGNRSRDTKPELRIRRILHAEGLRYRVDMRPVEGFRRRGDIVFGNGKVVVLVHGCFWHGCELHYVPPVANADYWAAKVRRNVERDVETVEVLKEHGWLPIVVWEHDDPEMAAASIREMVSSRRSIRGR